MQKSKSKDNRPPFIFWEYFNTVKFLLTKQKYLFVVVPMFGLILSFAGFCTAFQRSGAVLVAIAIYLAYYKQPILHSGDYYKNKYELTADTANERVFKRQLMSKMSEEKAERFVKLAADSRKNYKVNTELADGLRAQFYRVEATIGVSGTLIWAFGDLICCI